MQCPDRQRVALVRFVGDLYFNQRGVGGKPCGGAVPLTALACAAVHLLHALFNKRDARFPVNQWCEEAGK